MNEPKPFRMQGARRETLNTEWNTVKARVAAQNAQPSVYTIKPLPPKATPLQKQWHETQVNVAKQLGLLGKPSSTGNIYGDDEEDQEEGA